MSSGTTEKVGLLRELVIKRFGTICLVSIVLFFIFRHFCRDELYLLLGLIHDNLVYSIAIAGGFVLYRQIYLSFRSNIVIKESDPESNLYGAAKITRSRFARMKKINGSVRPSASHEGYEVYHVKSADYVADILDFGHVHDPNKNSDVLLTYEKRMSDIIEENSKLVIQCETQRLNIDNEGPKKAIEIVDAVLEPINDILRGGKKDV